MAPWLVLRVEGRAGRGGLNLIQQKVLTRPWTLDQCHSREKKRFYPSYRCAFKDTGWICHHGPSLQKELSETQCPHASLDSLCLMGSFTTPCSSLGHLSVTAPLPHPLGTWTYQ